MNEQNDTGLPDGHVSSPPKAKRPLSVTSIAVLVIIAVAVGILLLVMVQSNSSSRPTAENAPAPVETAPPTYVQPVVATQPTASDDKWYSIENVTGKCKPNEGPAKMMKDLKTLGQPYEIKEDIVEGDKPMQVRLLLNDGIESGQMVYYRGKARCKEQAALKKKSVDSELNRYK